MKKYKKRKYLNLPPDKKLKITKEDEDRIKKQMKCWGLNLKNENPKTR